MCSSIVEPSSLLSFNHMAVVFILLPLLLLPTSIYGSVYKDVNTDEIPSNYASNNNSDIRFQYGSIKYLCPTRTTEKIVKCSSELKSLSSSGYPWDSPPYHSRNRQGLADIHRSIGDPLDILDHICGVFEEFQECCSYNQINYYCFLISPKRNFNAPHLNMTFYFICKMAPRNVDTVHTLQCLQTTRALSVLQYHIGNHCVHGPGVLENQMQVFKKAWFYMLDIPANFSRRNVPPVLIDSQCLPRKVIEGCVKDIIDQKCGKSAAKFVERFITFRIEQNAKALSDAGLSPIECDSDQISQYRHNTSGTAKSGTVMVSHHDLGYAREELHRMLSKDAAGSGLDTVYGKRLEHDLKKLENEINPCNKNLLFLQYEKCLLLSDAMGESPKYSILQSAHGLLNLLTQGTMCSRLDSLVACWKLQKNVCRPATRGFEHDFILQIESCHIQQYMETIQCEWQDMLFEFYIEAANNTSWPLATQSGHPLFLDNAHYDIRKIIKSFEHFIQLLQPGVRRIASRCGSEAAEKLQNVYRSLRYALRDAFILKLDLQH